MYRTVLKPLSTRAATQRTLPVLTRRTPVRLFPSMSCQLQTVHSNVDSSQSATLTREDMQQKREDQEHVERMIKKQKEHPVDPAFWESLVRKERGVEMQYQVVTVCGMVTGALFVLWILWRLGRWVFTSEKHKANTL